MDWWEWSVENIWKFWTLAMVCSQVATVVGYTINHNINFGLPSDGGRGECRGSFISLSTILSSGFTAATVFVGIAVISSFLSVILFILLLRYRCDLISWLIHQSNFEQTFLMSAWNPDVLCWFPILFIINQNVITLHAPDKWWIMVIFLSSMVGASMSRRFGQLICAWKFCKIFDIEV